MVLTNRERSDLEVIHRLFGVDRIWFYNDCCFDEWCWIGKTSNNSFVNIYVKDFPSLKKGESYFITELLSIEIYPEKEKKISKNGTDVRKEYYRQWRAKNPDKVREKNRRYWEKRAQKIKDIESTEEKEQG